ncbi:hypothetical protein GGR50DRAFT_694301 [Xylaria sp. CBS 124048]|nr:hypothetical protein GGR50DRAFT_694301 [Xylaria sp. CBS 124048]
MALTVKHLNSDASFLLSFEPIIPESIADSVIPSTFTILLDPWITGPSTIIHPKISITSHKYPACISSLSDLSQPPDLVIISQHKPDHCNEATLRQLPPSGTKTLILAEPASARLIKSWKYFDKDKVRTIERWEDPRLTGKQSVIRIPIPSLQPGGREGEVTIAFVPQKRDLTGLHGAIGITYRSPPTHGLVSQLPQVRRLTPPSTPESLASKPVGTETTRPVLKIPIPTGDTFLLPPTPPISPISPGSLRSTRSASTLITSTNSLYSPTFRPATASQKNRLLPPSPFSLSRPISLIFSPHGIHYADLAPYATSHLVAEAALPLTALLHCMDSVSNPWWLGGNICAGVPYGAEIASKLGARLWISAHDGEKKVRGLATGLLKTRRWEVDEVECAIESELDGNSSDRKKGQKISDPEKPNGARKGATDVLRLQCGEEVIVSGIGQLWLSNMPDEDVLSKTETTAKTTSETDTVAHRQKKDRKMLDRLILPKVQDAMSPKKLSNYKTLSTRDLLRPSPKIVIEQEALTQTKSASSPLARQTQAQAKGEKGRDSPGADCDMPADHANDDRPEV